MSGVRIALYSGSRGAIAELEGGPDHSSITLVENEENSAVACINAALLLESLAAKFRKLAKDGKPFNSKVQDSINEGSAVPYVHCTCRHAGCTRSLDCPVHRGA